MLINNMWLEWLLIQPISQFRGAGFQQTGSIMGVGGGVVGPGETCIEPFGTFHMLTPKFYKKNLTILKLIYFL